MSTTARELCPTEDTEQICLFRWAGLHCKAASIQNLP